MIVVSDTSPINYLTLIGHEALLQSLFAEIIIPASVFDELSHPGAPVQIQHLLSARPAWLRIVEPAPDSGSRLGHLDHGERDAILLGIEMQSDLVLMDEAPGREAAQAIGLRVIGTIGVLERFARAWLMARKPRPSSGLPVSAPRQSCWPTSRGSRASDSPDD